jgi:hypothetical protein
MAEWGGLRAQAIVCRPSDAGLGLGGPLCKRRRWSRVHGRRDWVNLIHIDRLNLHASWLLILVRGLVSQRL